MSGPSRLSALAVAGVLFLATAAYYVLVELHKPWLTGFDIYGYYLPIKIYAVQSVFDGGKGLLWTPFQSCGQPFFANTATGLLYPPHLLFLVLDANVALHVVLVFNMVMGALGTFLLLREMGLAWVAALGGALVFELGDPMAQLTGWSPMQSGSWTWVPWALLLCERLLRAPSRARVIGLAAVLALTVLPGWVLITALTYQLIALRVAWEILTRRRKGLLRASAAVGAGLALMPFLIAVQLVPAVEFANETFRVGVEVEEFTRYGGMPLSQMLTALKIRQPPLPFVAVLLPLAAVALLATTHRRLAAFWILIGAVYGVLALGPATPLYGVYAALPPGPALTKYAHRLFWITGLSMAVLTAFAIDAFSYRRVPMRGLWVGLVVVAVIGTIVYGFTPGGLRRVEAVALAVLVVAYAAALAPSLRAPAAWTIVAAIILNVAAVPLRYVGQLLPSLDAYHRYERSFATVRGWETPQDRVLIHTSFASSLDLSLMTKTASIQRLKEFYDYDALVLRRLVEYQSMSHYGEVLYRPVDLFSPKTRRGFRQRMLDVAAVRYVITVPAMQITEKGLALRHLPVPDHEIDVYANDTALPRARFVPRVEVVRDPAALLHRLAYGSDDPRALAFVEDAVPSGFSGEASAAAEGTAVFAREDPEHLIIDVDAPARGFLVIADAYYPGWRATVNDVSAPIMRANYVFRLVEVPSGRSRVELRYRPASVAIGAVVSLGTLVVTVAVLWQGRRRR